MKDIRDTTENWYALALSIMTERTSEESLGEFNLIRHYIGRPRKSNSPWNESTLRRIRKMRAEGLSWSKIGREFGVAGASAYKAFYTKGPYLLEDWRDGEE